MTPLTHSPLPVCWHEGMLLSPQHFQQHHIYWENQLQNIALNIAPYRWGIINMAIDEGRLLDGVVSVTRLLAIMPDGLQIDYDLRGNHSSYTQPLQIDLKDVQELSKNNKVKVQLTVPIRIPGSASNNADIQRFLVVDSHPAKDDNTGEGETELQRLQPIISLQATEHVRQQYVALPLFEVALIDGGQYEVSQYCPPILGIGADHFLLNSEHGLVRVALQQRLQNVAFMLRKKARQLAGFSEEGEEQFGNRVSEQHRRWIRAMVQHLAEFELLADNKNSSPWQVYQVLARLIGSMCELDTGHIPPKLPAYCHDDCATSLDFALAYITQQLEQVNLRYTSLAFDEGQDGIFSITFDKSWSDRDLLIELKPRANQTQSDLVKWLDDCRIASVRIHKELSTKRLLGASTTQTEFDETTGIHSLPGHALFYIKVAPQYIKAGQPLALACTNGNLKHMQPKRIVLHLPHESGNKTD